MRCNRNDLHVNVELPFVQQGNPRVTHAALHSVLALFRNITGNVVEREEQVMRGQYTRREPYFHFLVPHRHRVMVQYGTRNLSYQRFLSRASVNALEMTKFAILAVDVEGLLWGIFYLQAFRSLRVGISHLHDARDIPSPREHLLRIEIKALRVHVEVIHKSCVWMHVLLARAFEFRQFHRRLCGRRDGKRPQRRQSRRQSI